MRKETIEALVAEEKEILGSEYVDIKPVLERTLTVGELIEALRGVDPSLPLLLEVAVNETGKENPERALVLETAYLLNVFEIEKEVGEPRLVMSGCRPEIIDFFVEHEEL